MIRIHYIIEFALAWALFVIWKRVALLSGVIIYDRPNSTVVLNVHEVLGVFALEQKPLIKQLVRG